MEEERIEEIPEGAGDIVSAVVVEPEEPRLSVLHLMVWATCVAVYMSGRQTAMLGRTEVPIEGVTTVFFALLGMLGGTMLASLPLLVVRRVRGQMFPRSGGEILWILVGLGVVSGLMTQLIHGLLGGTIPAWTYQLVTITMALFVWLPAYVYAIVQSRGRWRIFFVFLVTVNIGQPFLQTAFIMVGSRVTIYFTLGLQMLVVGAVLVVVAVLDFRDRERVYPWPHWIGVLVGIGYRVLLAAFYIYLALTTDFP